MKQLSGILLILGLANSALAEKSVGKLLIGAWPGHGRAQGLCAGRAAT